MEKKGQMNKFKILCQISITLAIILSNIMCAVVAYNYCAIQWGGKYEGWSAPPSVAFLSAIPFVIGIIICVILAWIFHKKSY